MAKFERFEDILAWQEARELVGKIYRITADSKFAKDFGLGDQIRRASVSIMLNIAEGFARRTNKEFGQFLFVAHGSTAEVQSALYVAMDQQYVSKESFDKLYSDCAEISRMISGLIKYLWSP
jgi:four helix bundle protein